MSYTTEEAIKRLNKEREAENEAMELLYEEYINDKYKQQKMPKPNKKQKTIREINESIMDWLILDDAIKTNTKEQRDITKIKIDRLIELNDILPLAFSRGYPRLKKEIDERYDEKLKEYKGEKDETRTIKG